MSFTLTLGGYRRVGDLLSWGFVDEEPVWGEITVRGQGKRLTRSACTGGRARPFDRRGLAADKGMGTAADDTRWDVEFFGRPRLIPETDSSPNTSTRHDCQGRIQSTRSQAGALECRRRSFRLEAGSGSEAVAERVGQRPGRDRTQAALCARDAGSRVRRPNRFVVRAGAGVVGVVLGGGRSEGVFSAYYNVF